jgi:hypothetical protein
VKNDIYKRRPLFSSTGVYLRKQLGWERINHYNYIDPEILNNIIIELDSLKYSAVRIGHFNDKNTDIATSQQLPYYLIDLTNKYYKLFKFLNNNL